MAVAANAMSLRDVPDSLVEKLRTILEAENKAVMETAKRSNVITLREFKDNQDTPDPVFRRKETAAKSMDARVTVDCSATCGTAPHLDLDATCASDRWAPQYVASGENSECECLKDYRCCDGNCPLVDKRTCWGANLAQKGLLYGTLGVDCCGCEMVECQNCAAVETKEEACPSNDKPLDCYDYSKHDHYAEDEAKCWRSKCYAKASDAPKDKECDKSCKKDKVATSHCLFDYNVCEASRFLADCPRKEKNHGVADLDYALKCYAAPVQIDDNDGGYYFVEADNSCTKCQKWRYDKLSCDTLNKAAADEDCHKFGENEMDKLCFTKKIKKDDCDCDVAECLLNTEVAEEDVFGATHECPKNHVKMSGVSICMEERDMCHKCPTVEVPQSCENGKIEETQDCNGCPKTICARASVPDTACECGKYALDKDTNTLSCDCIPPPPPLQ